MLNSSDTGRSPIEEFFRESEQLDRKGDLILGPPRLLIARDKVSYLMRPVGHLGILEQMALVLQPDMPYKAPPQSELILASPEDDRVSEFIIQGRDGIGAQFSRL